MIVEFKIIKFIQKLMDKAYHIQILKILITFYLILTKSNSNFRIV